MNLITTNYNYMMTPPLPAFDLNSQTHERGMFAILFKNCGNNVQKFKNQAVIVCTI